MSTRPEALFPLFSALETLPGVGDKTSKAFANMNVHNPKDLVLTLPVAGIDRRIRSGIAGFAAPGVVTVKVRVERHIPARAKGRPYRVDVSDGDSAFQLVFFHARTDWLQKQLPVGEERLISGKLEIFDGLAQMVHPDHILQPKQSGDLPEFEPVYPLTHGITQKIMARAVAAAVGLCPVLPEWIDTDLKAKEGWPNWMEALVKAHAPDGSVDILPTSRERTRLAYDELFAHQLTLALARGQNRRRKGRPSKSNGKLQTRVLNALPYVPTGAQMRAVSEIQDDMASPHRMNRLLQGDVGSGKTFVALMALLTAVEAGGQGAMMAPTEILARQHLQGLRPLVEEAGVVIEILTGRDSGSERKAKLAALAAGDIAILVGTHALFQKDVVFRDLKLAVVDEQHRFGVSQRLELGRKSVAADVLVMTATPIPRSLSLAQYGDMDVSVLDEKPPGRTPVTTALVSSGRLNEVIDRLKASLEQGRQAYWVCPLVEESETLDLAAAEDRFKHLRAIFGEGRVGLVHGQMPSAQKDAAMAAFVAGETKCLVATTVIEVGVDVPNASIMVIERAETFGLAQLHQLRGRVGRGATASTCLLMYQAPLTEGGRRRLETLRDSDDGFRIAEEDLAMRGAGDVLGTAQSGLPRFRIADLERQSGLMAMAQKDARRLIVMDPTLTSDRGKAARTLLWLLEQDRAIEMISVG
ncbi:ATP-dependent DNA helicase RecG [Boseongicola aestuarii]|uniref:ATP-dependent DNA helicase RecG n=1 Tax=Boseongicola aestuarii TaxID=1470561 RepID=A0A238IUX6_9RHOB|nr:ATP-dependent DNA helicase RecG [Boseongicola aestuarii]SMX22239.1 ATP-dependent DNA helicase RecG [Boseongicola aestuarii]